MKKECNQIIKVIINRVNKKYNKKLPIMGINEIEKLSDDDWDLVVYEFEDLLYYPQDLKFQELISNLKKEAKKPIRNFNEFYEVYSPLLKQEKNKQEASKTEENNAPKASSNIAKKAKDLFSILDTPRERKRRKKKITFKEVMQILKSLSNSAILIVIAYLLTGVVSPFLANILSSFSIQIPAIIPAAIWTYVLGKSAFNAYKIYRTINPERIGATTDLDEEAFGDFENGEEMEDVENYTRGIGALPGERVATRRRPIVTDYPGSDAEEYDSDSIFRVGLDDAEDAYEAEEAPSREEASRETSEKEKLTSVSERLKRLRTLISSLNDEIKMCDTMIESIKKSTGLPHAKLYNKKVNPEYVEICNRKYKLNKLLKDSVDALNLGDAALQFDSIYDKVEQSSSLIK